MKGHITEPMSPQHRGRARAAAAEDMRFQVNDHLIKFGCIVRVEEVGRQQLVVRFIDGPLDYPFTMPKGFARDQRKGHWRGDPIPPHRLLHRENLSLCEPYTFSHVFER